MSPAGNEFLIGQIVDEPERRWALLGQSTTWMAALRKAMLHGALRRARILASHSGEAFRVLEPKRLWLGEERCWRPCDEPTVSKHVPPVAGVYVLRLAAPIYVGQTDNLRDRLIYHLRYPLPCAEVRRGFLEFCVEENESADERVRETRELISWWAPPCNQPT